MVMAVFVLDKQKKPLMPCSEKRARKLLEAQRARIDRMYPFTIRLVDRTGGDTQPLTLKIDPGSKQTGMALVRPTEDKTHVVALLEAKHRGQEISKALAQRAAYRRRRRSANLRYRAPRFDNRRRPKGRLAPSIQHRVNVDESIVSRITQLAPVSALVQELVRFDTQLMENPEITGIGYQQGTLAGFEVREYVFSKWGRNCVYCDKQDVPLNLDHVHARAQGGSDRVSNLVPACIPCNQRKGDRGVREFLAQEPARLDRILRQLKKPLRDAAAVNTTRWALFHKLEGLELPLGTGTGGRTKWNRRRYSIPKTHALDAVCTGNMDAITEITGWQQSALLIASTGRGSYQRTRVTASGFPRGYLMRQKAMHGFQTGDMVKAFVTKGKKSGDYLSRVAVRATGSFNLQTSHGVIQGISHRDCRLLERANGFSYSRITQPSQKESENGGVLPTLRYPSPALMPGSLAQIG
jgi:5-methylcytosine-specific restriction endonuclease McrA